MSSYKTAVAFLASKVSVNEENEGDDRIFWSC